MSNGLAITVYGGAAGDDATSGEIGGNKVLIETGERSWFLDFGMSFGRAGRFFDEFLQPRDALGLRDYLRLGLIPPLEGIYRPDLTLHEQGIWEQYRGHPHHRRIEHLDGVLLSHAHQDHNGYIGLLRREVPIYTGLMTALIGKGMQDLGSSGGEFSYLAPKELTSDGVLKGTVGVRHGRPHCICEGDDNATRAMGHLKSFLSSHPGSRTRFDAAPVEVADLEPLGVRFFRVDHSIPGSGAFAIKTPIGWVGYTGDLRLHGHSRARTEKFTRELAALKPLLLIVEGTRLDDKPATDEPAVREACDAVVRREPGLVIADFSARNIERLRTFRDISQETGRQFVVTCKDAYLLQQMHIIDPNIPSPADDGIAILRAPRGTRQKWEQELLESYATHVTASSEIRKAPGNYILALSYWDIGALIDIEPASGTYIYSSSEAYDEEQMIDHQRLAHWLNYFKLTTVGGLPGAERGPFHASGHIDGPGMELLVDAINPDRILPVHTQKFPWFLARWPEKVVKAPYAQLIRYD